MRSIGARLPSTTSRLGCLSLLVLPFAAIGAYTAFLTVRTLLTLMFMQGWTIVPATLQTVELSTSGQTQRAVASYSYVFNGQSYTGRRVSLYTADNLGSFHEDAYRKLHDYLTRNEPYPAHVNPKAPAESILMPVLRLEAIGFYLVFTVVFGGVGWGIIVSSAAKTIKTWKEAKLVEQYPDEPWKHRVEWMRDGIKSSQRIDAVMETSFAIFWNAATFPILLIIPRELGSRNYVALTFLVVPLIGAGLAYWALVALARAKRFGSTYLKLDTMPGRPGEKFLGRIYAPRALESARQVALSLRCEATSQGAPTSAQDTEGIQDIWRSDTSAPVIRGTAGEAVIEVAISIPAGLPDSWRGTGDQFRWLLAASAPLKGADFSIEIEVPVFGR